ncbi:MAG: response regulator [Deltaproteobacteria bacterium]|nr:response regulator [Deltaproteobacteria bacterium]
MGKPIRLLIVEDVEDDALLLVREIRTGGFEPVFKRVDSEKDLAEALKAETWDIIISDYAMPGFTGIDALRIAKKHDPDIPFILISGAIGEDIAVRAMKEGAGDYLMKDNLKRLIPAIERELQDAEIRKARREAVKALEESKNKYRLLVEDLNDVIYRTDQDGIINYISPVIQSLAGYDQSELIGQPFTKIIYKEDLEFLKNRFEELLSGVIKPSEYRLIQKSGESVWVRSSGKLVYDGENVVGVRGVLTDISEEKQLQSQLQQSQKMEAIGTLAGGIAHDFNNILMAIIGYCDLAESKLAEDSEAIDNLNQARNAGNRARRLIQQILAFSRMGEQERIALSLTPLIKEALKFLRSTLPTSIEIRDYIEADPGIIEADATQIHQIMMNLCTNAGHAMREEGGTLHVKLIRVEVDGQTALEHHELHTGPHVRLTVTDTGCGMDSETLEHVFDPYFTTKEKGEGTGLGLSVVHGIVNSHGSTITVESEPGKGTTFHVYFPIIEKEEKPQKEDERPLPTGNERILFVDDEQMILDIGKELLGKLGYDVVAEKSSVEALELFRADPDQFDLVITDMTMPKMTGDKLAGELMKVRPDIPIILCTGFSPKISEEQAKEIGIKAFAMKPLVRRDMANIVRKALGD